RGEEAGQTVEIALPVLVPHVGAFTAHDHRDLVGLVGAHAAEVHPQIAARLVAQVGILGTGGAHCSSALREGPLIACPRYRSAWPASGTGRSRWSARPEWS